MHRGHKLQKDPRNGNYCVQINRSGLRRYFQLGHDRKEAERRLADLEKGILIGQVPFGQVLGQVVSSDGSKDMHVKTLAHHHLEWVSSNRAPGTFRNRQTYILRFLDFVGSVTVSQLTRKHLEDFYSLAKRECSRSVNGGNEAMAAVKAMLRWGEEMELVTLPFKRFPPLTRAEVQTRVPTDDEWGMILSSVDDNFGDMLKFGILTGLRPRELRELTQAMIRSQSGGVTYVEIQRHKTSRTAGTPKPRSVPLGPDAEAIVRRQVAMHPLSTHIFLNLDGNPFKKFAFRNRMRRLCTRLGIPMVKPYALRHAFATMQSDSGMESTSLARLMGHTTTRTLSRYIHNNLPSHKEAMERLELRVRNGILKAG